MASVRRASPAPRKANGKYEAILRAAIKVFAGSGFFNSKVADVAREAGVADGTVYLYFRSKDDILASIFNHYMDDALAAGRARLAEIQDPIEKLRRIVHAHLEGLGRDRNLAVVFQVELRSSTKFMEQFSATKVTEYLELIREVVEEGQRDGVFRKDLNTKVVAKVLFGALDEMATNWVLSHKRYSLVSTAQPVLDVFLNGINQKQPGKHRKALSYSKQ
jgi:TetR/AcrR family transcriptional regulator, fatty acid metabolism regulator protein